MRAVIDLGVGQSFDVSSHTGYRSLTANDFIIGLATNTGNRNGPIVGNGVGEVEMGRGAISITKSYDNSTGILTAYYTLAITTLGGDYPNCDPVTYTKTNN